MFDLTWTFFHEIMHQCDPLKLTVSNYCYQQWAWDLHWTLVLTFSSCDLHDLHMDSQSQHPMFKTIGWLLGWLSHFPFEVNQMSARNIWKISVKKCKLPSRSGSVAVRQLNPIHKRGHKVFFIMFMLTINVSHGYSCFYFSIFFCRGGFSSYLKVRQWLQYNSLMFTLKLFCNSWKN